MKKKLLVSSLLALTSLLFSACDNPAPKSSVTPSSINNTTSYVSSSKTSSSSAAKSSSNSSSSIKSSAPSSSVPTASSVISSSSTSSSSSVNRPDKVTLDIFAFNDTHGVVKDTQGKGIGISKMSTLIKNETKDKNSIVISQGDMWEGSVESNYTRGNLVTEWMNQLGFVSMTVGNHEYDWGKEYIIQNQQLANFPTLGINVINRSTSKRVDYLSPSITFTKGGAKIGVIGAIGNCLNSISSSKVKDIYFAYGDVLTNLVKNESRRLRNEEKCDFIIYSIHGAGNRDEKDTYDVSLSNDHYVDLVLEGHTHEGYRYTDEAGIWHIQNDGNNETVTKVNVELDLKNTGFSVKDTVVYDTSCYGPYKDLAKDSETEALITKYQDKFSFAYETLGTIDSYKNSTVLRDKIAELYLEAGNKKWGNQYNIILGGGYLSCRGSGLSAGNVTYADLDDLFPFDNEIVLCTIKGSDLANTYYISGGNSYYVSWTSYGSSIRYNIDQSATYYLVTDSYGSDYSYNHLTVVESLGANIYARDLLADFIKNGGWAPVTPTEHAGTLADPKTIAEGLAYARSHPGSSASDANSEGFIYKGVVTRAAMGLGSSGDLYRVYVGDAGGSEDMQIYYLKRNKDRNPNWTSADDLKVGDEIIFYGQACYRNSTYLQFESGAYCLYINGVSTN